jgi:hypothetical protein
VAAVVAAEAMVVEVELVALENLVLLQEVIGLTHL